MDLKESEILQDSIFNHWYYISKFNSILSLVRKRKIRSILDIGAGSGYFSKMLLMHTDAEYAICIDTGYKKEYEEEFHGKKIIYKKGLTKTVNVDLVLMMDVIEHIADDSLFLKSWSGKISNNAIYIITVPAFQFLFSTHDVFLEHYRRYNLFNLRRLLVENGMKIENLFYFYSLLFIPVMIIRLIKKNIPPGESSLKSDLTQVSKPISNLLVFVHKIEMLYMKFNKFFGVTLVCLFQKK